MIPTYSHDCSTIPDGPSNVGTVLHGLEVTHKREDHDFYDRLGRSISVPRRQTDKSYTAYFDDGYAKALWDFRNDSLLLGDDGKTLYVRDVDQSGANRLLDTWHAISSLETEYHVSKGKTYLPWNQQMQVECAKLDRRVRHGVKFRNMAFIREDGRVVRKLPGSGTFGEPFELTIDADYDQGLAVQAVSYMSDVTADLHSARNLGRMFATPLLEPYKHLTYVMYGDGGNGKGILLGSLASSFPGLAVAVDSQKILGGRRGTGGFSSDQEMTKLIGALWAYDEDADTITLDQMTLLKKISTGDTVVARRIQENAVSFTPKCTFVVATNNPVITTMTAASARRFVYIRMRDGRSPDEFAPLLEFRAAYGAAPFIMASCKLWELDGDEPFRDVVIGDSNDLSQAEQWIVDSIVATGYAVSGDNPYHEPAGAHLNTVNKLGLKSAVKKIDGNSVRVLVVKDEQRFSPYREAAVKALEDAVEDAVPARPEPIEAVPLPLPSESGFVCDYTPAGADKVARNWKRLSRDPSVDTSMRPVGDAYAVVPGPGMAVVDMDVPEDGDDGWALLNRQVGAYGGEGFPATYLVGTPSGGVHAYYRLPGTLSGRLKNRVHSNGVPVDIRCEGKGYVIGPGSRTGKGEYRLLDVPDGRLPVMPPAMVAWLEANGYVDGVEPSPQPRPGAGRGPGVSSLGALLAGPATRSNGTPDMTPVAVGRRNQTLHDWAYGRLANYPGNADAIKRDLFVRGHASGLGDAELSAIWGSITRRLGGD
jgi:hypothetical protein